MSRVNAGLVLSGCIALATTGCGDNRFTGAQSEIAGYCGVYLTVAGDDVEINRLGLLIISHAEERGFDPAAYGAGVLRAGKEYEEGEPAPTVKQIGECRQVLNW